MKPKNHFTCTFILIMLCILSCFIFSGCRNSEAIDTPTDTVSQEEKKNPTYISNTLPEDCLLCGNSEKTLLPLYRGQTNVGIISLSTFDISPVEINRYDDYGNLIEESAGSMRTTVNSHGEGGIFTTTSPNTDRGYAHASVSFKDDEILDMDKIKANLCTDCLNTIMEEAWSDEPYGVGIINFETLEIQLFEESISAFSFGDYYISCNRREKQSEEDSTHIDLLIFYCPKRYE